MVAKGGARLLDDAAIAVIREALFPLAEVRDGERARGDGAHRICR